MPTRVNWHGESGNRYTFDVFPAGTSFNPNPGVYIFCKPSGPNSWSALYVGQTHDFSERVSQNLEFHQGWIRARAAGATHIALLLVRGTEQTRISIETDLRHALNPVASRQ